MFTFLRNRLVHAKFHLFFIHHAVMFHWNKSQIPLTSHHFTIGVLKQILCDNRFYQRFDVQYAHHVLTRLQVTIKRAGRNDTLAAFHARLQLTTGGRELVA